MCSLTEKEGTQTDELEETSELVTLGAWERGPGRGLLKKGTKKKGSRTADLDAEHDSPEERKP